MSKIDLITTWCWLQAGLDTIIRDVIGGNLAPDIKGIIINSGRVKHGPGTAPHDKGKVLVNVLTPLIPKPDPQDFGCSTLFPGEITSIDNVEVSPPSEAPSTIEYVSVSYTITYTNNLVVSKRISIPFNKLPILACTLIKDLHSIAQQTLKEWFISTYGNNTYDPIKWTQDKMRVFISYRSSNKQFADQVFNGLGDYNDRSVFYPMVDYIDMQAGNWQDQLMSLINKCDVFIPLLSKDYLEGPFSKPEIDLALRKHFMTKSKKIVPILIDGKISDYASHYIGGFHILDATGGITDKVIMNIANMALGVSSNPFKS